jgi:hypothetical protein
MVEALVALRDLLVALALGWIGLTAEPVKRETAAPAKPPSCSAGEPAWCEQRRPSYDVRECG